jgi:hypothetical protein
MMPVLIEGRCQLELEGAAGAPVGGASPAFKGVTAETPSQAGLASSLAGAAAGLLLRVASSGGCNNEATACFGTRASTAVRG